MDDIGHSTLLKFIVKDSKIPTMSEPNVKIQVSFDNPNITSSVPGEQKLRDGASESSAAETMMESAIEEVTNVENNASETYAEHCKIEDDKTKQSEIQDTTDTLTETSKNDFVLTPVMTVTKEEAVFTKGGLKLQKVTVTEDISNTLVSTAVEQENVSIVNNDDQIHEVVFSKQHIRTKKKLEEREHTENKKPKTRIPTLRFRQAVDKLKQDRTSFEDKKEPETPLPTPRRSSIPRLKDARIQLPNNKKDSTIEKEQKNDGVPRLSDEFDKLYDEMVDDQDSLDNLSMTSRIEDPIILDNTFEEIIHAYEEHKIQSVNVEKVKQSKIPLLKRKSENEIEVPKQISHIVQKTSVGVMKTNISGSITDDRSRIYSVTLNKSPIRTSTISKRLSETESVRESTTDSLESKMEINVVTVEENDNNMESKIIENERATEVLNKTQIKSLNKSNITTTENVETVKLVPFPTIEHKTNINSNDEFKITDNANEAVLCETKLFDKIKEQNLNTQIDETLNGPVSATENDNRDVINLKYVNSINSAEKISYELIKIETISSTEELENKNEEDILILRGKVNRIIKRMDSKETEVKTSKKDLLDDIPKKKSVQTKIAMYEHSKPPDATPKSKVVCTAEISNIKLTETITPKNDLRSNTHIISEDILTGLPALIIEQNNDRNIKNDLNKSTINDKNSCVPDTNLMSNTEEQLIQIETINIQPQKGIQSVEAVNIPEIITIEEIKPATDINPVINLKDNDNKYSVQIVDMLPKSLVVSAKTVQIDDSVTKDDKQNNTSLSAMSLDATLDNMNDNDKSSTNNQQNDFSPPLEENKEISSADNQNKYFKDKIHYKEQFGNIDSDTIQNDAIKKQNITEYFDDFNKKEPLPIDNRPQIISEIIKPEMKIQTNFDECTKKDKIKENGVFYRKSRKDEGPLRIHLYKNNQLDNKIKSKSIAQLDLGDTIKGRVKSMVVRMNSLDLLDIEKKEIIDIRERPRKRSVSEKIALFERKLTPTKLDRHDLRKIEPKKQLLHCSLSDEEYVKIIEELSIAKTKYGALETDKMKYVELRDGGKMPAIGIGTALLDPKLTRNIVQTAIDLGYRTIDTAFIYGNEKEVGEAINEKIKDGTVSRSELFIISKLWSTYHRRDLVQRACRASLDAMGLDYFDLYLIHNPMSFKEGGDPIPKIASVIQFSEYDYLDAWFGVENLVREGLVRRGGVSNFNSQQVDRVVEKGKIKPVINQVECHPYLSQQRLNDFCQARNVKLCCFGVLGSKGTPQEHKSALPPAIDDPLVRVMAAGLDVSPAALLISYQLVQGRGVIVKASNAAHLWDNLQALTFTPSPVDVSGLHALNRNKRIFTFKGMGDTHRHYPFNIPF